MLTLGIDTSNYATSLAVFDTDAGEVVCDLKHFLPVKSGQLGLRQSDALFHHTAVIPELMQKLNEQVSLQKIGAVGVSTRPRPVDGSYMPCFLAGVNAATAFCLASGIPLWQTTHQQGHIAAALLAASADFAPEETARLWQQQVLVFHVSGGTTDLLRCENGGQTIVCLGTSEDLYAGQAVDRLGVRLGFAFPAGAEVSRLAEQCGQSDNSLHPKVSVRGMNCSLSGLENQCNRLLSQGEPKELVCRYCLVCVGETLVRMADAALAKQEQKLPVVFAGGVMSSSVIRQYVTQRLPQAVFVPGKYASDNAIGVSVLAAKGVQAWPSTSV